MIRQSLRMGSQRGEVAHQSAELLNLPLGTINARRGQLLKDNRVYPDGYREGPTGKPNTIWKLRR